MKRMVLLLAVLVFCTGNLFAFSYSAGYYDFGADPFVGGDNNTAPYNYPNVGYLPSPGHHSNNEGERYDLEALFIAADNDYLYLSLTSSFGASVYSSLYQETYYQGDIFFGFCGNDEQYAIEVETGRVVKVGDADAIQNVDGSYYGNSAIRNRIGAFDVTQIEQDLGSANQSMTFWDGLETDPLGTPDPTGGDTYVWEWKIAKSDLGWWNGETLCFSTAIGCGNDFIEREFSPIPEPGTLILLGLGLAGAGFIRRRR